MDGFGLLDMSGSCQVTGSRAALLAVASALLVSLHYLCIPLLVTPTRNHCHYFGSYTASKSFNMLKPLLAVYSPL